MYEELYKIAEDEIPELGAYILNTQLNNLAIPRERIRKEDIPAITKAMTEAAMMFGEKKAKKIRRRILKEVLSKGEILKAQKDDSSRIRSLMDIGESALLTGDFMEALKNFEEARDVAKKNTFENEIAKIDSKIAQVLARMKEKSAALNVLKEAEELSKKTHTSHTLAEVYYSYGSVYWWSGEYKKSIDYFYKSLEICKKLEDNRLLGYSYMGLANAYSEIGDIEKDIEYSEMAILHFKRAGMEKELAKMYINIGVPYEEMGDFQKAETYYLKGLKKARETGYMLMEAWALANLSGMYADPSDADTAESYAKSALEIFHMLGDSLGESIVLLNLGKIYRIMRRYGDAKKEFEKAIRIKERVESPFGIADAYQTYGKFLKEIKDDRWKEYLKKAMNIYKEIGNKKREQEVRRLLGKRSKPS